MQTARCRWHHSSRQGLRQEPRTTARLSISTRVATTHEVIADVAPTRSAQLLGTARQFYEEVWSNGRVNRLNGMMHPDHKQIDAIWQEAPGVGRDRMKRGILAYRAAYPDLKFTVQHTAACEEGESVMVHWSASGTNLGPIRDQPPTHQPVNFSGITLMKFDQEGRIMESHVFRQAPADEKAYFTRSSQ